MCGPKQERPSRVHDACTVYSAATFGQPRPRDGPGHRRTGSGVHDEGCVPSAPRRPVLQRNTFMETTKLTKSKLRLSNEPRLTSKFNSIKILGDRTRACPRPKQQDAPRLTTLADPQTTTLQEERSGFQTSDADDADRSPGQCWSGFLAPLLEDGAGEGADTDAAPDDEAMPAGARQSTLLACEGPTLTIGQRLRAWKSDLALDTWGEPTPDGLREQFSEERHSPPRRFRHHNAGGLFAIREVAEFRRQTPRAAGPPVQALGLGEQTPSRV